ncbi:hypothetical protein GBG65_21480 (plasmid) [Curtobacterium flaccumfaciens pv. flaccumfaciens]|nr:hypothetical protein GBG65_21480 [Curtobacterium flaccumfaciens pv. flaccumfaciens]
MSSEGRGIWQEKLKIMKNEKHPLDDLKNDEITKKLKNEKCPLKDLEYGEKTEKSRKMKNTQCEEIWKNGEKVENFKMSTVGRNMARKLKNHGK